MQTTLAQPPSNTLSSSSKSPAKPAHRLLELDALRGLAAVAVMLFHYTYGYDKYIAARPDLPFHVLYGDRGVYLFFVLSGFVISWTLARTRTASDFVVGRFSRLYPAFWAAVPLTYFIVAASDLTQLQVSPRDALLNLTMIPNMLGVASVDGAYWSLQVELCFYATVLTLWLTGAWRRPLAVLAAWLAVATCWGLVLQLNLLPEGPVTGLATKLSTAANLKFISLFGIGICFYQWRERGRASAAIWTLLAACLAVECLLKGWQECLITTGMAIGFYAVVNGWLPFLSARPLVFLGGLSYTFYLVHQNIGYVIIAQCEALGLNVWAGISVAAVASILLAMGISYGVERPAMSWIRTRYRNSKLFVTTETLLSAMAAAAATGDNPNPPSGTRTPAATGTSSRL
jgi:peptidoglycan/LPS O-acetylase OafA/YrhL